MIQIKRKATINLKNSRSNLLKKANLNHIKGKSLNNRLSQFNGKKKNQQFKSQLRDQQEQPRK
jgi:hypothetical protein